MEGQLIHIILVLALLIAAAIFYYAVQKDLIKIDIGFLGP